MRGSGDVDDFEEGCFTEGVPETGLGECASGIWASDFIEGIGFAWIRLRWAENTAEDLGQHLLIGT